MDWLKFAFDTLIVGTLALPWLWLFMRIFFQRGDGRQDDLKFPLMSAVSDSTKQTIAGVLVVALGYFLGSAVSRISSDFFDDDEILLGMPNRQSIRHGVYLHEYCDEHSVLMAMPLPAKFANPGERAKFCGEKKQRRWVEEFFGLQEARLLLEGEEKLGRLRELHDQIEILRGATLNGAILFGLSWFGLCALYRARLNKAAGENNNPVGKLRIRLKWARRTKIPPARLRMLLKRASFAPAVVCLLLGVWDLGRHILRQHEFALALSENGNILWRLENEVEDLGVDMIEPAISLNGTANQYEGDTDPPLAEALLVLLGVGGLCLRPSSDSPRLFRNVCLMALVLTLIGYGSWWWTEVLYDQQVIHSVPNNIQSITNF